MTVKIFFCYAHEDEDLLKRLKAHLKSLERDGLINMWYDRNIGAGTEWERQIDKHLATAQIILLLVSPDFMNSDYCYSNEMKRALERHMRGEARVIPIILHPFHWQIESLKTLLALPKDGEPVTGRVWRSRDEEFLNVVEGIQGVIEELATKTSVSSSTMEMMTDSKASKLADMSKIGEITQMRLPPRRRASSQTFVSSQSTVSVSLDVMPNFV
ncbi:MAG TPA: toll/interleukin-1 receptor domain-containing protein [Ktedonobacteraceae bacterium]|nr:toll/interleukin-1 receptor domain-containing protein [Ktedonobacteraceae bacterium]